MGLFENFPYTNFHELNLMWILQALKEIQTTTEQFVALNSLKYADPIQWNIVSQYEKNTIVIDPLTGTAYISVQPVPSGVSITNTDYWTVVFDLGSFVTRAAKNFTVRWEEATTLTATFPTTAGEWIVWGDTLYKALVNITAGDQYVVNSNIEQITMEQIKNDIYTYIDTLVGDLANLSTTDKSNLVAAINEVLTTLGNTCGDLTNLSTTDKSNLVAAINEVIITLTTAINDHAPVNVKDHGVVGDGVTDDTTAFQAIITNYDYIYIPRNCYIKITDTITVTHPIELRGGGSWTSRIIGDMQSGATMLDLSAPAARGSAIRNLYFTCNDNNVTTIDIGVGQGIIENCDFLHWNTAIRMNSTSNETITNCLFSQGYSNGIAILVGDVSYNSGVNIIGCNIFGNTTAPYPAYGIKLDYVDGVNIDNCILNNINTPLLIEPKVNFAHSIRVSNTLIDGGVNFGARLISNTKEIFAVSFTGCWFMASSTNFGLQLTGTNYIQNVSISNSEFLMGLAGLGINTDNAIDISCVGCKFSGVTDTGITAGNGKHLSFVGNNFNNVKYLNNAYPNFGIQIGNCEHIIIADNISTDAITNDLFVLEAAMSTTYLRNNNFAKSNYKFVGNTADAPAKAPIGSTFESTDERTTYRFNGVTWTRSAIADVSAQLGSVPVVQGKMHFSTDLGSLRVHNGNNWGMGWKVGATADRPGTGTQLGDMYFDTTLNKPIWYGTGGWIDASGTSV